MTNYEKQKWLIQGVLVWVIPTFVTWQPHMLVLEAELISSPFDSGPSR